MTTRQPVPAFRGSPFIRPRPVADPAVRLIGFHHAGGSASGYFPLSRGVPAGWDLLLLDLPGRGKRHNQPVLEDMADLVAVAARDVAPWVGPPIALFGHSLGAIVAVEVARALAAAGAPPVWLGVSGRVAPGDTVTALAEHRLDDAALLAELLDMGGIPSQIAEIPEFRDRFLGLIRRDLRAVASYRPDPGRRPLDIPLTAFGASDDPLAPLSSVGRWSRETAGAFRLRMFAGGHFHFLGAAFDRFTAAIVAEIARVPGAGATRGRSPLAIGDR